MKKTLIVLTLICLATSIFAVDVAGVNMPATLKYGCSDLVLNGTGVRKKIGMNIYAQALYLTEKSTNGAEIIASDKPMAIRLAIVSSIITSKMFIDSTTEAYTEATNGNTAPIQAEINAFMSAFSDGIKKGDYYDIVYNPCTGLEVYKNGAAKASVCVKGKAIKEATFAIWVGPRKEKALQTLRDDLLGLKK